MKTKRFLVFGLPAALLALGLALAGCESPTGGERGGGGKPATPTGVKATVQSSTKISVSWDSVSKASDYSIYRAASSGGSYSYISSTGSSPYTDTELSPNTTYYYKVSANNDYGESAQSSYASAKTSAPGEDPPTGDLSTSWTQGQWESWFNSRSNTDSNALAALEIFFNENLVWIENNLWWYDLVTDWDKDDGKEDEQDALSAPTGVSATAQSSNSVYVSWNYVSGASGYRVYRSDSSYGSYSEIGWLYDAYDTSYTDTGLSPNTTYYYKVSAYSNSAGEGAQSYSVPATIPGSVLPAPTGVSATAQSSDSISVSWYQVSGASSYRVYRSDSPYGNYSGLETAYGTSYTDTGLSPNTTYYYQVAAYNSNREESERSNYVPATTPMGPPATPTGLTATAQSSSSIYVSWSYVSGATGYHVYRADSSGSYQPLPDAYGTFCTDTGLLSGTIYSYRVSAYNSNGGESERSTPVSTATHLPPSGTLSITVGFDLGAITITGNDGANTIRQTGSPQALTLRAEGYTDVVWYVDGSTSGTSDNAITINAEDYTTKLHSVTFTGTKNGAPYAQAIPFTVLY
jgi:fibronectin type 3 domain-containing protein